MSATTPAVSAGSSWDPASPAASIPLDSPAWLAWPEAPTARRFAYPLVDPARGSSVGFMTARKEGRRRGGASSTSAARER